MVAGRELDGAHHGVAESNGLALGRHEHDFLADLDAILEPQQTGDHELRAVGDGVDGGVLDDDALVAGEQGLERLDNGAEVALVAIGVVLPLSVENIVHRDKTLLFVHGTAPHTPQLLHVRLDTHQVAKMLAQHTDVRASLAADPERSELPLAIEFENLAVVDGADAELALDGGDEGRTLEDGGGAEVEGAGKLGFHAADIAVEANYADVLLACALLRLHEPSRAVDADDQAARHLRVESATMAGFITTEDPLDPRDDFVRGGVGGFVEVDDTEIDVVGERTLERGTAVRNWGEVSGTDENYRLLIFCFITGL